jgi:hypothetical protein
MNLHKLWRSVKAMEIILICDTQKKWDSEKSGEFSSCTEQRALELSHHFKISLCGRWFACLILVLIYI